MKERDIHFGKPTVDIALENLNRFISESKKTKEKIIKVIVGYGSTGKTHKIKTATINLLIEYKENNKIQDYIIGSDLDIFKPVYQKFKFSGLIPEIEKRQMNPGVVFIVL